MFEVGDLVEVLDAGGDRDMIGMNARVVKTEPKDDGSQQVWLEGAKHGPWGNEQPGYTNYLRLVERAPDKIIEMNADYLPYYQAITGEP